MRVKTLKRDLIIIGTGLFPEVARCYFDELSDYQVVAFACHSAFKDSDEIYGLPLVAVEELTTLYPPETVDIFVGVGYQDMNRTRERIFHETRGLGYRLASFCHPDVHQWQNVRLGENTFIFEDNTIQPFVQIGDNTVLWSGNHIGHHSKIGNHCFISSHVVISGSCHIGNNVFMGVNATVHDSITIEDYCLVGAGAVISKNADEKSVFVPPSTKVFKRNSDEIDF